MVKAGSFKGSEDSLLDLVPVLVIVLDVEGNFLYINQKAERTTGWKRGYWQAP